MYVRSSYHSNIANVRFNESLHLPDDVRKIVLDVLRNETYLDYLV